MKDNLASSLRDCVKIGYKSKGLVDLPKLEGCPCGWKEERDPIQHGLNIRRTLIDKNGFSFCIESKMPWNVFQSIHIVMFTEYVSPEGLIYFTDIDDGFDQSDCIIYPDAENIPIDKEFLSLVNKDLNDINMESNLTDIYGSWCIWVKIESELEAFAIADLMSARSLSRRNKNCL